MDLPEQETELPDKTTLSPFRQQDITPGLFKRFVETSQLALGMADLQGRIVYINSNFARLIGIQDAKSIYQKEIYILHPPEIVRQLKEEVLPFVQKHDQWVGESAVINQHGQIIPTISNVFLLRDDGGNPLCFATVLTDISERKHMEQELLSYRDHLEHLVSERTAALKTSNMELSRLTAILDSTSDLVSTAFPDGRLFYLNAAGRRLLGLGLDDPPETFSIAHAHPPLSLRFVQETGIPAALAHGVWEGETAIINREGVEIPISQVIMTHRDEAGELAYISTIMRDISERKRLEDQLLQAQKMEAVGQLAGGVAHDFNNLLQAILGYLELVTMDTLPESHVHSYLMEIKRSGERAAALTRQLLAFSRKQVLELISLDINAVLSELLHKLRPLTGEDIELVFKPGASTQLVRADRAQIEHALGNICMNACEAMPEGGRLVITTSQTDADEAFLSSHTWANPGNYCCISITDTGGGMDRNTLQHIFEPFFTTKDKHHGSGLGLAMVYGIIRQHQGMVEARSTPGQGTCFTLYLPCEPVQTEADSSCPAHLASMGGTETILLAEDEEMLRNLAQKILTKAGYQVLSARDGQEALDLYAAHADKIALLFLDVIMPKKGGPAVYQAIKTGNPAIKCLFASGYSADKLPENDIPAEGLNLLQKPYTNARLLNSVRQVLDKKS